VGVANATAARARRAPVVQRVRVDAPPTSPRARAPPHAIAIVVVVVVVITVITTTSPHRRSTNAHETPSDGWMDGLMDGWIQSIVVQSRRRR
jgi:hypothetical protein